MIATTTDPSLGAIRLAWWRERLDELDVAKTPPSEPRLQATASELVSCGISGSRLSALEDAWLPLLQPIPWGEVQAAGLKLRGRILFGIGAHLLGERAEDAEAAGELWSLVDGAHHCSDPDSRHFLVGEARIAAGRLPARSPLKLRPLTVLAAVAASDGKKRSGIQRGTAALAHRLRGTYPQG